MQTVRSGAAAAIVAGPETPVSVILELGVLILDFLYSYRRGLVRRLGQNRSPELAA